MQVAVGRRTSSSRRRRTIGELLSMWFSGMEELSEAGVDLDVPRSCLSNGFQVQFLRERDHW